MLTEYDRLGSPDHPAASALIGAIYTAKRDLTKQVKTGKISREQADELTRRYANFSKGLYYHRKSLG